MNVTCCASSSCCASLSATVPPLMRARQGGQSSNGSMSRMTSGVGARFENLVEIMRALRAPDGCPWDREQTLASLRPFLLEETYEALEALDRGDLDSLREELGDLLFEIVFLARIAEEGGHFSAADAAADVGAKLVRRHPHVFGDDARLKTAEEVRGKWEEMKAAEGK